MFCRSALALIQRMVWLWYNFHYNARTVLLQFLRIPFQSKHTQKHSVYLHYRYNPKKLPKTISRRVSGDIVLPASSPQSRPPRLLLRWRAEFQARRKPAQTRPLTAQLQTSEPPSSPKGAKIKVAADGQEELPRCGRIQEPSDFKPKSVRGFFLLLSEALRLLL